jgi:hypothetical protein
MKSCGRRHRGRAADAHRQGVRNDQKAPTLTLMKPTSLPGLILASGPTIVARGNASRAISTRLAASSSRAEGMLWY